MLADASVALQPFVDRLRRHSPLSDEEQAAIQRLPFSRLRLGASRELVRTGEKSAFCCFVAEGLVARYAEDRAGLRQITALQIPGDMPDLHSAILPGGLGGLITLSQATVFRVPHAAVLRLIEEFPALTLALWRDTLLDAAMLMSWVANVGRRSARQRIAHIFCEMSVRYAGGNGYLDAFEFPITQVQLGEAAGLTNVHVNRTLRTMRETGLVELRSGKVIILNRADLIQAGDFDPAYLTVD